jgi:uncharacterized protein YegL
MNSMEGQQVMLFYIICDESGSMGDNGGIDQINSSLPELHSTLVSDPLVVDKSRLSIIAFSDIADVILPMQKVTDIQAMPGVRATGATNYGEAFALLRVSIQIDVDTLKSQGYRVLRPCVFFMSDGEATDNWEPAYRDLMNHQYRPNIICWGVDGADPNSLSKIATIRAFVSRDKLGAGRSLASVMSSIGNTIVSSVSNAQGGQASIDVPLDIDGFDSFAPVPLDTL